MADKGIIFSAPMVRALLDGRKTQTRRLLSLRGHRNFSQFGPSDTPGYDWHFRRADGCWCDHRADDLPLPYAAGDRLYVREHWKSTPAYDDLAPSEMSGDEPLRFLADDATFNWAKADGCRVGKHRQGMHMPRWASRLWLAVTDVRVQRLQDIGQDDAIAEGIEPAAGVGQWKDYGPQPLTMLSPKASYGSLWNSLHTKPGETWADNPWIVAVSFDVHHGNIDQVPA